MNFSELQFDVLKEAFNVGAGRAAASLEELVVGSHELKLSVPEVEVLSVGKLCESMGTAEDKHYSGVVQSFSGPFSGAAVLLYSEQESLEMVRALLGHDIPIEDLPVMRSEALREIGNIVLNATLGGIAELLELTLRTELPVLRYGTISNIFIDGAGYNDGGEFLYLKMRFSMSQSDLDGHIAFTLDIENEQALVECLDAYLSQAFGL